MAKLVVANLLVLASCTRDPSRRASSFGIESLQPEGSPHVLETPDGSVHVVEARQQFAEPPLHGVMKAKFSSNDYSGITSKYDSGNIEVFWYSEHGFYSWIAPFVEPQNGLAAETGWAQWLRPFEYSRTAEAGWHSRSYVGTRVDVVDHTSCCCQYIRTDNKDFRISEFCDIVPGQAGSLSEACAPFMVQPCPSTNASAWRQKSRWNTKPYHEAYSADIQPLDVSRMPYLSRFQDDPPLNVTEVDDAERDSASSVSPHLVICVLLLVLACMASYGLTSQHGSDQLKADRDIIRRAVEHCGRAVQQASAQLRGDRGFAKECKHLNGQPLQPPFDEWRASHSHLA